jgi:PIN domain nuclease of toxin-antitoxin system
MKYLLDSHTFIWLDNDPGKLSPKVAALFSDRTNQLLLSIASVWEMQIKLQIGKLTLPAPLANIITEQQTANGIQLLPIDLSHVLELASLADHHKDPFDRLLIAQARIEQATLVTDYSQIAKYAVPTIW